MLSLILPAFAAEPSSKEDGRSWLILPGAFYSQETSVGFAVYGSATTPLPHTGETTWPSTLNAAVVYTLENQASLTLWPTLYLGRDNTWIVAGSYGLAHFPTRYFGIGPSPAKAWQDVTRRWFLAETTVLRRLHGPLYAGPTHILSLNALRDVGAPDPLDPPDPVLGTGAVLGEAGGVIHGLGLTLRYEQRDNPQSTRDGLFAELRPSVYSGLFGSVADFTDTSLDLRAFHTLDGDWTFAAQVFAEVETGEVPFTHLAELGGDNLLRGLYQGRFRGRDALVGQGELRFPLYWRFRGAAFAGVGQVFDFSERHPFRPVFTAGGGLRFELDELSHNTLRLDFGGGPEGAGMIFTFGEAF